jgi:hypothetical protein
VIESNVELGADPTGLNREIRYATSGGEATRIMSRMSARREGLSAHRVSQPGVGRGRSASQRVASTSIIRSSYVCTLHNTTETLWSRFGAVKPPSPSGIGNLEVKDVDFAPAGVKMGRKL